MFSPWEGATGQGRGAVPRITAGENNKRLEQAMIYNANSPVSPSPPFPSGSVDGPGLGLRGLGAGTSPSTSKSASLSKFSLQSIPCNTWLLKNMK